jgi:hypothetical protein
LGSTGGILRVWDAATVHESGVAFADQTALG